MDEAVSDIEGGKMRTKGRGHLVKVTIANRRRQQGNVADKRK